MPFCSLNSWIVLSGPSSWCWHHRCGLVGEGALSAVRRNVGYHVKICGAGADCAIGITERGDGRGVELGVWTPTDRSAIYVVTGHGGRTGGPRDGDTVLNSPARSGKSNTYRRAGRVAGYLQTTRNCSAALRRKLNRDSRSLARSKC